VHSADSVQNPNCRKIRSLLLEAAMKQFLLALILGGILYAAPHGLTKAEANQPLTAEDKLAPKQ
jgi:hypothetical protein